MTTYSILLTFVSILCVLLSSNAFQNWRNTKQLERQKLLHTNYGMIEDQYSKKFHRVRRSFLDSIAIESIEIKLNWEEFLKGKRIGSAFTLKKNRRYIENALLYSPKDGVFTVRGLLDATSYIGEVRVVIDKKVKFDNSSQESIQFKINSPRIVTGMSIKFCI